MASDNNSSILKRENANFEAFMNHHIGGILVVHQDGLIVGADEAAAKVFGLDGNGLSGKYISDFIPQLSLPLTSYTTGQRGEAKLAHPSGQVTDLAYTLRAGWGQGSSSLHFIILHLKDSEQESLALYTHMFEWMPVGLAVYKLDEQRLLTCNRKLLRMLGFENEAALREDGKLAAALHPQLEGLVQGQQKRFELTFEKPGRNRLCLAAHTALIPALEENLTLVLLQDISSQKAYEGKLQESRNKLEAVISNAVDGIIIIDAKGHIQMTNQACSKLFGYAPEEMNGQNISMLMPQPHRAQHDGYLQNYHRTGQENIIGTGRDVEGQRKDGSRFPFRLGVSKIATEQGLLFTGVIHDLSETKLAEQKIVRLNQELERKVEERTEKLTEVVNKLLQSHLKLEQEIKEREAAEAALRQNEDALRQSLQREKELSELKSRFVSMASHEFRTPLTAIASSAELIGLYAQTEQQHSREKHLKRINSAVTNLTGILSDFLSLSKLEEGKIHNTPSAFCLASLIEEALDDVHSLLKPGQTITEQLGGIEQEVFLDRKILKNIFLNLLSNAIKYSPEGSTIWLTADVEGERLQVSLRDEGIGIPQGDQAHLFSRFFRAENAANIQGTGLGLNIVHRYLELLGGHIRFESTEGVGTTFWFELPLRNDSTTTARL